MNSNTVEFYFDFLSPYSYVAWTRIRNDESLDLKFIPVTVAAIISHYETKGPGQIETKRNYLMKDLLRFTKIHKIPFVTPPTIPFNSLYALRCSLYSVSKNNQKKVIDCFFKAVWERGLDIGNSDIVSKILLEENLPSALWMDLISSKEIRQELKQNVQMALNKGVFGVPTFFLQDEMFWGNDSIDYLKLALVGQDPLPKVEYQNFLLKHPFNQ